MCQTGTTHAGPAKVRAIHVPVSISTCANTTTTKTTPASPGHNFSSSPLPLLLTSSTTSASSSASSPPPPTLTTCTESQGCVSSYDEGKWKLTRSANRHTDWPQTDHSPSDDRRGRETSLDLYYHQRYSQSVGYQPTLIQSKTSGQGNRLDRDNCDRDLQPSDPMTIPATGKLTTEPLSGPDTDCTPYVRNAPGDGQVYVEGTEKDKIGLQLPLERLTSEEKFSHCAAFPNYLLLHPEFCVSDSSSDKFDSYPCLRLSQSSLASSSTEPTSRLVDSWVQLPYNSSFARSLSDSSLNHLPGCGATTGIGQLPGRCCTKDRYHLQVPGRPMYKCQCADQCARSAVTLSPALHSEEQMDNSLDRHHRFYGSSAGLSPRASPSSSLSGLSVGAMSPWMSDSYVSSKSHLSLSAHPFLDRFDLTRSSVDTRGTSLSPRIDDDFHGQAFPYLCSRDRSPCSPYMMSPSVPSPSSPSGDTHPSPHPSPRPSPSLLSEKTQLSSDVADSHQSELRSEGTSISDSHMQQTSARSKLICRWKLCGQRFSNQRELALHVNDDHVRIERPALDFQCHWQGCPRQGKGFNARYKMLIHIRTHTNEKPHECSVCGKCFSRLENLKIHTRSHTGEKPYVCTFPGCNKAYSNSSDRFKHVRTHQEEKPYKCKMLGCRKQYTDPSSLRKHVRTHGHTHGNNLMLRRAVSSSESYTEDSREKKLLLAETTGRRHSFEAHTDLTQRLDCDLLVQENTEQLSIQKSIELYGSLELRSGIHKLLTVDSMEGTSPQSVSPSHDRSDKPVTNCAKDSVTTESRQTVACEELRKKFDVPSIVIHEPATSVDCQPQEKITWPSHNTSGATKLTHTLSGSNIASGQAMEKQGEETSGYKDNILTSESKSQDCDEREDRQTQKEKFVPSPLAFSTSERQTQQGERNHPQNVDATVISPGSYPVSPPTSGHPGHWKKRKLLTREREMVSADTTSPSVSQVTHHSLSPTVTLPAPVTSPCDTSPSSSSVSSSIPSIITQPPSPPLSRTSHCSDVSPALALPPPPLIPSPTYTQPSSQLIVPAPFMSRSPSIPHHSLSSPIPSSLPSPSSSLSSSSSSPHSLSLFSSPSISPSFLALPGLYSSSTSHPQVDPYPVHLLSPLTLSQSSQGHQPATSLSIAGPKEMTKHLLPSYLPARLDHLGELNHLPPSMTLPPLTSRLGQLYQEFPLDLSPYYLHYGLTLHTASPLNVAIKR